ncbi:MAG: beta-ketoacyl synthase N-terminal-like domain-containing protein [Bacteroidia bacterium]
MYVKLWSLPEIESLLRDTPSWTQIGTRPVYRLSEIQGENRCLQLLLALAEQHSVEIRQFSPSAVYIGSSRGEIVSLAAAFHVWERTGKVLPSLSPDSSMGTLASQIARYIGISGPAITVSQTCLSGLSALHTALLHLCASEGEDTVLFGAVDAPLTPFFIEAMAALRIYTKEAAFPYVRPGNISRNNTFALGEGAVLGLLSRSRISPFKLVELRLYTAPARAGVSFTAVDTEALATFLSQLRGDRPDFVLLHAPGTAQGDAAEWEAVRQVWGEVPVLSIKSRMGHTLGAAPLFSLAAAIFLFESREWLSTPYPTFWEAARAPNRWHEAVIIGLGYGGVMGALRIQYEPQAETH